MKVVFSNAEGLCCTAANSFLITPLLLKQRKNLIAHALSFHYTKLLSWKPRHPLSFFDSLIFAL